MNPPKYLSKTIFTKKEWDQFNELCAMQCTIEEICSVLKVSAQTLSKLTMEEFGCVLGDIHKVLMAPGKVSIRRNQMKISQDNCTMLIWLGKVYLGQRDYEDDRVNLNGALGVLDLIKNLRISDDHADPIKKASSEHS